jgi:hypothetical protein
MRLLLTPSREPPVKACCRCQGTRMGMQPAPACKPFKYPFPPFRSTCCKAGPNPNISLCANMMNSSMAVSGCRRLRAKTGKLGFSRSK